MYYLYHYTTLAGRGTNIFCGGVLDLGCLNLGTGQEDWDGELWIHGIFYHFGYLNF